MADIEIDKRGLTRIKAYMKAGTRNWQCLGCDIVWAGSEWILKEHCPVCGCKIYKDVGRYIGPWDQPRCTDGACCYGIPF